MMKKDQEPGELLMVGFDGVRINDELRRYILRWKVGGVILFGRNIRNPDQVAELCGELAELRRQVSDRPLLIAVDQEGGTVARLREGVTIFPGNLALGFAGSIDDAFHQGLITGSELSHHGININLAPVLDLYSPRGSRSLGLRSLGCEPERTAELGVALIKGMQGAGIVATAKHFPGKGRARRDSHQELPVIWETARELKRRDLLPFCTAIDGGVKAIMTSHAAYPAFEGGAIRPATFSRAVMSVLLRDELRFRGLLISDDLGMGALRGDYSIEEAALSTLKAGVDMLLLCHSPDDRERVRAVLKRGGKEDRLVGERMEESRGRIAALQIELASQLPCCRPDPAIARGLPLRLARGAVSISKLTGGGFTIGKGSHLLMIRFQPDRLVEVEEAKESAGGPDVHLRTAGFIPEVITIPLPSSPIERERVLKRLKTQSPVIIASYDAYRYPHQRELIEAMLDLRPDAVLAVTRDPRDADLFPGAGTVLITRGYGPLSIRALAEVIAGKITPRSE